MRIRTFRKLCRDAIQNISRNRVMSLASIIAVMSALFILGAILVLAFNLNHIAGGIESKIEITAFLDPSVDNPKAEAIVEELKRLDGVYEIEYISKEEGLAEWKRDLGDKGDLLDGYMGQANPLPDKLILNIENPEYVEDIIMKLDAMPRVDKVNYSKEVVDTIGRVANIIRTAGLIMVILLVILAMIIINNTIRMTVYSRRREINIMKYIGATDSYIRWPFILEGLILGLVAALFAGGLVFGGYILLLNKSGTMFGGSSLLNLFRLLPVEAVMYDIGLVFLLVGTGVGVIASALSVRKHLRV
ncbi:MAG: ABC transporter permease [Clostridiales bacterium]|nr:ABC transporter permease [Clostridiales bacterium]